MVEITATMVNELRAITGAPLMKCKAALIDAQGNFDQAERWLREHGVKTSLVEATGNQGYIAVYAHPGNQSVALVELASTTDFVARSEEFQKVASELAMQVAAMSPIAISVEDISHEVRENEIATVRAQLDTDPKTANKPESLREEIARAKVGKKLEEQCLLTQDSIRDPKVKVGSMIDDLKLKVREGVYVRRIARWQVGEGL